MSKYDDAVEEALKEIATDARLYPVKHRPTYIIVRGPGWFRVYKDYVWRNTMPAIFPGIDPEPVARVTPDGTVTRLDIHYPLD